MIREHVEKAPGYDVSLRLASAELTAARKIIEDRYLEVIGRAHPELVATFRDAGIERYHEHAHLLDHARTWKKDARMLDENFVRSLRSFECMRALERAFGAFELDDEERLGGKDVKWRLVRPNAPSDVASLHTDASFYDIGYGHTPAHLERVKVWVAIHTEPGLSGLRVVPNSQHREWRYRVEDKDGMPKPVLDEDESQLDLRLLPLDPGGIIVFNDRLLHTGAVTKGSRTRVSFEFMLLVPKRS